MDELLRRELVTNPLSLCPLFSGGTQAAASLGLFGSRLFLSEAELPFPVEVGQGHGFVLEIAWVWSRNSVWIIGERRGRHRCPLPAFLRRNASRGQLGAARVSPVPVGSRASFSCRSRTGTRVRFRNSVGLE